MSQFSLGAWRVGVIASLLTLACLTGVSDAGTVGDFRSLSTSRLTDLTSRHALKIQRPGSSYVLDYWANGSVSRANPAVTRIVVMVHGNSRNAAEYAHYTVDAARDARAIRSTLVVAPRFVSNLDDPPPDRLEWTEDSWKEGGRSILRGHDWTMTSFSVMSFLLRRIHTTWPDARIMVAGHSAGGQFVQRYVLMAPHNIVTRFVPMNPGSYMYLDKARWARGSRRPLTAAEQDACPHWDQYKYGFSHHLRIYGPLPRRSARGRYAASPVTYMLGAADTVRDADLDVGCEADWQGLDRLRRGQNFFRSMKAVVGAAALMRQSLVVVPGVAHAGGNMIRSTEASAVLFH